MALASLLMIGLFTICTDLNVIFERGLWYGFDGAAAVAVLNSALGGLVVSAVLRYAASRRSTNTVLSIHEAESALVRVR